MRCRRCGHDNEDGANYCSSCGAPLDVDEDTTAALALIEDRQSLAAELGDVLDDLPEGLGLLVVRRGPNAGSTFVLEDAGDEPRAPPRLRRLPRRRDGVAPPRRRTARRSDGYQVADAGSLNGTYVDHERVESAALHDMSELQVGRFVLTFVIGGASGTPSSAS